MAREVVKTTIGPREVPAIKPPAVQIEAGLYGRAVQVRLPAGVTPQDLHDWPAKLWGGGVQQKFHKSAAPCTRARKRENRRLAL